MAQNAVFAVQVTFVELISVIVGDCVSHVQEGGEESVLVLSLITTGGFIVMKGMSEMMMALWRSHQTV